MQQGPRDQPILAPSDWQGEPQHLISQLYQLVKSVWALVCHTRAGVCVPDPGRSIQIGSSSRSCMRDWQGKEEFGLPHERKHCGSAAARESSDQ